MSITLLTPPRSSLEVTLVRTPDELRKVSCEWHELWRRSGQSPFQSPMWLLPWTELFTSNNLMVLVIRASSTLIGIAPFYTWREGDRIKLLLAGNGFSDYLDVCFEVQYHAEIIATLSRWMAKNDGALREFNQLQCDSPLLTLGGQQSGVPCPVLDLQGKTSRNYAPPRQLEKLRYYRRRAEKLGFYQITRVAPGDVQQVMRELFRLHARRWKNRVEPGVLQDTTVQQFHLAVATNFAEAGNLRLYALLLGEQIIGVLYGFADQFSSYYYLSGFDPKFEKISPGSLLIGHAVEEAIAEGQREFNFLRGAEPYKYAWGAKDRPTFRCVSTAEAFR